MCVSSNIRYPQSKSIWCHVWSKLVGSKWKAYECECKAHRHEPLRRNSKLYGIHDPIDCSLSPQTNSYSNNQELESCREVAVARARASQTTRTFGRQISSQPKQRPHTAPQQPVLSGCRESRPPSVRWGSTSGVRHARNSPAPPARPRARPPRVTTRGAASTALCISPSHHGRFPGRLGLESLAHNERVWLRHVWMTFHVWMKALAVSFLLEVIDRGI